MFIPLTLNPDYLKQTLEGAIIDPRKNQRVMRALLAAALFCRYFELGGRSHDMILSQIGYIMVYALNRYYSCFECKHVIRCIFTLNLTCL